ncbi:hypothetical protein LRS13_08740 [Svornostia abyssi]|uniref:Calcium-binding protein n=1 Tax=Svornostia abyssi TaxID=2898438 RepID=A0ABY5PLM4_9ACTN|nr:hypothetical protein LRS13_08740 [Parviterribacteraceae bacterium J379]
MHRTITTALAALATAGAFAAAAPSAHALAEVSSGPDGLRIVDVTNLEDNWSLALVEEAGATKYRFSSGGGFDGIRLTGGCVASETRGDTVTAATCVRINPVVRVGMSGGNDFLAVPEDFPDPLTINGGLGRDAIQGGADDDVLSGDTEDDLIRGRAGNDAITGGSGDDELFGDAGNDTLTDSFGVNTLDGGEGDDVLTIERNAIGFGTLIGGPGRDTFTGGDESNRIDARDGEPDTIVSCGEPGGRRSDRDTAIIDLVDAEPPADCEAIDRSNRREGKNVRIDTGAFVRQDGRVGLHLICPKTADCAGTVTVRASRGGKVMGRASFSVRKGESARVSVRLSAAGRRQILRGGQLHVTAVERGRFGKKTSQRVVRAMTA